MAYFNPRPVRPGDPIPAAAWNALVDQVRRGQMLRGGSGMSVRRGAGGLQLAAIPGDVPLRLGIATANIGPRSGSTCGTGTLALVSINPDTGAIASTGDTLAVVNPSSSTFSAGVSIKSGQYCCAVLIAGAWCAFPLEC